MGYVVIGLEQRHVRAVRTLSGDTVLRTDQAVPGEDAVFERIDLAHGRVALRVPDGRYLARHLTPAAHATTVPVAPHGALTLHLVEELTPCAAFEELRQSGGVVSLRGCDQRFLGVTASGDVVADRVADGSWERFHYLEVPVPLLTVPPLPLPSQAGPSAARVALAV